MSDEKETKPEGASEQITIRVRDQVSVLSCPVLSYFTVLNNWQSTAFIKIESVEVTRAWAFDTSIPINHTITHSHTHLAFIIRSILLPLFGTLNV